MSPLKNPWLFLRAFVAFFRLLRDLSKLDAVFEILNSLEKGDGADEIVKEFSENPIHANVFVARPRIGNVDMDSLMKYPEGSLGRTFAEEMKMRNLNPADIERRVDDGTPAGYVFSHFRETHDIWHTATGFDVDVAGELGLQAFYLTQFKAKLSIIILAIGLLNTLFFALDQRTARMDAIARGWQMGRRAKPFFGFDWAANWATPLSDVRAKLGIPHDAPVAHSLTLAAAS